MSERDLQRDGEGLQSELEEQRQVVDSEIDNHLDFDQIKAEGMSIRVGGKKMKLYVDDEEDLSEVEEVRRELREKYNQKLHGVREYINDLVSGMYTTYEGYKQTVDEERRKLERARIDAETDKMPEITYDLATQGLSVTKGHEPGSLVWLYRDFYWPKFYNGSLLEVDYSKELITPIIIEITTKDYRVTSCRVCKFYNLDKFQHYHNMGSGDCWGTWSPTSLSWENPVDILRIGQRASQILTEVNGDSPGAEQPAGFPRITELTDHIKDDREEREKLRSITSNMQREGAMSSNVGATETVGRDEGGATWSVD